MAQALVSDFYNHFPYPECSLDSGAPKGYNWKWCFDSAFSFSIGALPSFRKSDQAIRILDAGCGSGFSTNFLAHLNPGAEIFAVDISSKSLEVAERRLNLSGANLKAKIILENRSFFDLDDQEPFDFINSVGVIPHLDDPHKGFKSLSGLLKKGGLLYMFVYAHGGRYAVQRVQKALKTLGLDYGSLDLTLARQLFDSLPRENPLRRNYEEIWQQRCLADIDFADTYLHPQETSFSLDSLISGLNNASLDFLTFSDSNNWKPQRLLDGELLERALSLSQIDQYRLIELLDSDIGHFEFFASKGMIERFEWKDKSLLLDASAKISKCLTGWPGRSLLDYQMNPIELTESSMNFLLAVESAPFGTPLRALTDRFETDLISSIARDLQQKQVLMLCPA